MKTNLHFLSYLAQFFIEWEIFQTKVVEKIKTHVLCSATFFHKSCRLWDNVEWYCKAGQPTDDDMAHAHCMLDNESYRHTLSIWNTYCFSTATVVMRTRLTITSYMYLLSCSIWRVSVLGKTIIFFPASCKLGTKRPTHKSIHQTCFNIVRWC
jgi:hypothetical protein